MDSIKSLDVFFNKKKVGTLAEIDRYASAFEYDSNWLSNGFSISPLSLPLEKKLFIPKPDPFGGLYGVFADSLPDGWGRLLVDRLMLSQRIDPNTVNSLTRLAIVGASGMGALSYQPEISLAEDSMNLDYDEIALECARLLETEYSDDLDELFHLGGSSGGARPKILTKIDGEEWIIKFPSTQDKLDIGQQEYLYSLCAKACGLEMTETRLFPSKVGPGYFGTKRFDRISTQDNIALKKHMLSVSALLETSHRTPNLDYDILMRLTRILTNDIFELKKLYRIMCFNVFAHNRDDHSKNFSFIYDENAEKWSLAPAYDLTHSYSIGGEHATTINGNGKDPSIEDILAIAKKHGLPNKFAIETAHSIEEKVHEMLGTFLKKNL